MRAFALIALTSLAACAATPPPATVAAPPRGPTGVQRVMGQPAERVVALLGQPTLDRSEGSARVLQFARTACVLDLFLYPGKRGVAVTEAEARKPDGRDTDAGRCIEAQLAS